GLSAAGAAAGTLDLAGQILEGRLRGAEAAAALGRSPPALAEWRSLWASRPAPPEHGPDADEIHYPPVAWPRKRFVCLCEDVTEKDLAGAIGEGFDHIETLKRYSTVSMGPCQGKVCGAAASEFCARLTGRSVTAVGATTARPPAVPVELAVLAAERRH